MFKSVTIKSCHSSNRFLSHSKANPWQWPTRDPLGFLITCPPPLPLACSFVATLASSCPLERPADTHFRALNALFLLPGRLFPSDNYRILSLTSFRSLLKCHFLSEVPDHLIWTVIFTPELSFPFTCIPVSMESITICRTILFLLIYLL